MLYKESIMIIKNINKKYFAMVSMAVIGALFKLSMLFYDTNQLVNRAGKMLETHLGQQGLIIGSTGISSLFISIVEADNSYFISRIKIIKEDRILEDRGFPIRPSYSLSRSLSFKITTETTVFNYRIVSNTLVSNYQIFFVFFYFLFFGTLTWFIAYMIGWYLKQKLMIMSAETQANLAKQVSHDIRSPLSALNMILPTLSGVHEDKRLLIRNSINRINDIANQLLEKGKKSTEVNLNKQSKIHMTNDLLSPLLDNIVSEKRIQFREKQNIDIEADISQGYGLFVKINSIELKRALSNLINNSVEALLNNKGRIIIAIRNYNDFVSIIIQDNGKGIPEQVLKNLGEIGVTYGKEETLSGSGLGVYHAKKTTEDCGGKFVIQSQEDCGTTITLSFPKASPPKWFVDKLFLKAHMNIISIDDDISIHQIWKGRFESKKISDFHIEHLTFTSGSDFKLWFSENKNVLIKSGVLKTEYLFLIDYELLNQNMTGIDLIKELGIGNQSILVTSRYEEDKVREKCERLGVRLIPKAMSGFVPIEIEKPKELFDAILIDDDKELVHVVWDTIAKNKGLNIKMFSTPQEFFLNVDEISRKTPIYVDVSLGTGIKGTDIAEEIHKFGFFDITLTTGYDADSIEQPSFIRGVIGKEPPF